MRIAITLISIFSLLAGYAIGFISHIQLDSPMVWLYGIGLILLWSLPLKKRILSIKALLVLCSVTWAYVLVDVPLRLFYIHTIYQRLDEYLIQPFPEIPKLIRMKATSSYQLDIKGDLSIMSGLDHFAQKRQIRFETNSRGFRNNSAHKGPYDIILLGDSVGTGAGTDQRAIASEILAREFGYATYNMSVPGTGPWNELLTLQEELQYVKTKPSTTVVWLLFSGNDLESLESRKDRPLKIGDLKRKNALGAFKIKLRVFRNKSPIKRILKFIGTDDAPKGMFTFRKLDETEIAFFNEYANAANRTTEEIQSFLHINRLESIMKEMKNFTKSNNLNLILVVHPTKSEVYRWLYNDQKPWSTKPFHSTFYLGIKDLAEKNNVRIFDLTPAMIEESNDIYKKEGKLLWWADDTHPNGKGHHVTAKKIVDWVNKSN